ncbi:MAG TPA: ABC transporter substrate binding protein [Thermotogota bacterium]|nr:ABC transporter substrate binding protein [Thermotogota bacterium]
MVVFWGLLFVGSIAVAQPMSTTQNVLVLSSYHDGMPWTDRCLSGLRQAFSDRKADVELYVEHIDSKRFALQQVSEPFMRWMQVRYSGMRIDVIIALDNNALEFLLDHRQSFFPGIPVVFVGINDFSPQMLRGETGITGVVGHHSISETIDMALSLFPQTQQILVVNDKTETGIRFQNILERILDEREDSVSYEFAVGLSTQELTQKLQQLSEDALVLLLFFHIDALGVRASIPAFVELVVDHSPVPVFSFWDHYLGLGILGGVLESGFDQGLEAGKMALDILAGAPPEQVRYRVHGANVAMVDFAVLQSFGVPRSRLPKGTVVINDPGEPFRKFLPWLLSLSALLLVAVALVILLLLHRFRLKKTSHSLQQSKEHFRTILHSIDDAVITTDLEGNVVEMNPVACQVTGFSLQSARGKAFSSVVQLRNEQTRQVLENPVQKVFSTGSSQVIPSCFILSSEGVFSGVSGRASPIFDEHQTLRGVVLSFRDITREKLALEELKKSEEKMQWMLRAIPDVGVFVVSLDSPVPSIVECNEGACKILEFHREEILGKPVSFFQKRREPLLFFPKTVPGSQSQEPSTTQVDLLRRSSDPIPTRFHVLPFPNGDNSLSRALVVFLSLEKERKLEKALDENEKRTKLRLGYLERTEMETDDVSLNQLFSMEELQRIQDRFLKNSGLFSVITDPSGEFLTIPRNFPPICRLVHSSVEGKRRCAQFTQKLGSLATQTGSAQDGPCEVCGMIETCVPLFIGKRHMGNWILGHATPDGSAPLLPLEISQQLGLDAFDLQQAALHSPLSPLEKIHELAGFLESLSQILSLMSLSHLRLTHDMAERKKMQNELRKMNEELQQKSQVARKLAQQAQVSSQARELFLANINHELRTPLNGITGVLQLFERENLSPQQQELFLMLHKSTTRLKELVENLLNLDEIDRKESSCHSLWLTLEDLLRQVMDYFRPRAEEKQLELSLSIDPEVPRLLHADPFHLEQILGGLVSNAIKFTLRGRISLLVNRLADQLRFEISDTGIGMDAQLQQKVFGKFEQGDPSFTKSFQGAGLGLTLSKFRTEEMGGTLQLFSEPGMGSNFVLSFPLETFFPFLQKIRVLLLDPAEDACPNLPPVFAKRPGAFQSFQDPELFLEEISRNGADVAIMDLGALVVSKEWLEKLSACREKNNAVWIGTFQEGFSLRKSPLSKLHMDFWIEKPVSSREVLEILGQMRQ